MITPLPLRHELLISHDGAIAGYAIAAYGYYYDTLRHMAIRARYSWPHYCIITLRYAEIHYAIVDAAIAIDDVIG